MAQFKRVCRIHVEEPCGDECSPECRASWHLREAFSLVPRNDGRRGRMAVCFDCYRDEMATQAPTWPRFGHDWR